MNPLKNSSFLVKYTKFQDVVKFNKELYFSNHAKCIALFLGKEVIR